MKALSNCFWFYLFCALFLDPEHAHAKIVTSYVIHAPQNMVVARVIVDGTECPFIRVDESSFQMKPRGSRSQKFPVLVCEHQLDQTVKSLIVDGQKLPVLPHTQTEKILVLGDTGCRMKEGSAIQHCQDPEKWPFAEVALSASRQNPDVVIHVGDYIYRERGCKDQDINCVPSSFGDNWQTWWLEFFRPAEPLLKIATWVTLRGDHESCARSGPGYFLLLDPRPLDQECRANSNPYPVELKGLTLINFDSSSGNDKKNIPLFNAQFASIGPAKQEAWLITHMPLWGFAPSRTNTKDIADITKPLQAAFNQMAVPVTNIVSGHIHQFQMLSRPRKPNQYIVGMGGTSLDWQIPHKRLEGLLDDADSASGTSISKYGYAVFTKNHNRGAWDVRALDKNGEPFQLCLLNRERTTCKGP